MSNEGGESERDDITYSANDQPATQQSPGMITQKPAGRFIEDHLTNSGSTGIGSYLEPLLKAGKASSGFGKGAKSQEG